MKTIGITMGALALSLTCGSAWAQTSIHSQQMGQFRFDNGTLNGQTYQSTTHRMGNIEFQNGTIGGRSFNCTTQHLGGQTFTNCN